ncbi:tRNA (guanosine(46)-N7)-methyltransferase TrmB [Porphyromonas pogonae]|uniref:tRNA (guanosine(46)-N7)-methyltransferase TrmB n=1 Tax=Porphyromonas pogonae TaxID=867595 RepID=UPI002E75A4F2|nr:tRNA (guanosine(46)-N7)-methyltransferase TrmB [Porphyromonas pogonae]
MGKNKLAKFAEMETFPHVFQFPFARLQQEDFPLKGEWSKSFFKNDNPIVVELGCGKGEYAVGLARRFPHKNFIGMDVKGARIWTGAKESYEEGLDNVAFIRGEIEMLESFFGSDEIDEIWITFPDPQMKKTSKRLTSTRFLNKYMSVLKPEGIIHLKTDSPFLYIYTKALVELNQLPIQVITEDLYASGKADEILEIKTYYERQWLDRGLTIKYIRFAPIHNDELVEPDIEIEPDSYRSFSRSRRVQ